MGMRDQVLAMKQETTPGTFEALVGADAIFTGSFVPSIQEFEEVQSEMITGLPGNSRPAVMVSKKSSFAIPFDWMTSGVTGTAPPTDKLLLALGYSKATVASTSVTYTVGLTETPSATRFSAATGIDGQRYAMSGALATEMEITCEPNALVTAACTLQGNYVAPTDVTNFIPTFPAAAPAMPFNSSSVLPGTATVAGYAACINAFSYKITNTQAFSDDASCGPRFEHTNREISGSITIKKPPLSVFDPFNMVLTSTLGSIVIPLNGGAGNTCTINNPKVQFKPVQLVDIDGVAYLQMEWMAIHQTTADFSRLIFT